MKKNILVILLAIILFPSCMDEPQISPDTNEGNLEALWQIIDTKYCYLDYKQINWDSIKTVYQQRLPGASDKFAFFDLMGAMLGELKDGQYLDREAIKIRTVDGIATLQYNLQKKHRISKRLAISAKTRTPLGNTLLVHRIYQLNISN